MIWLYIQMDNRGHRLLVTDDSAINTPAVAAAHVVRRYTAQAQDEISLEVGNRTEEREGGREGSVPTVLRRTCQ